MWDTPKITKKHLERSYDLTEVVQFLTQLYSNIDMQNLVQDRSLVIQNKVQKSNNADTQKISENANNNVLHNKYKNYVTPITKHEAAVINPNASNDSKEQNKNKFYMGSSGDGILESREDVSLMFIVYGVSLILLLIVMMKFVTRKYCFVTGLYQCYTVCFKPVKESKGKFNV